MEEVKITVNSNSIVQRRGELNYLVVMPLFQVHPDDTYYFPLGIPYISSSLKQANFNVYTLNLNHKENPYELLRERIEQDSIDVVLTGAIPYNMHKLI